jgi:hypothetical protein
MPANVTQKERSLWVLGAKVLIKVATSLLLEADTRIMQLKTMIYRASVQSIMGATLRRAARQMRESPCCAGAAFIAV